MTTLSYPQTRGKSLDLNQVAPCVEQGKSARASMDLQSLSDAQTTDFAVDPTFQQLVSNSLIGLCCLVSMIGGGDIL